MKRLIQSIVVAAGIVIALGSCNKETNSTGYAYTSLTDFYNKNGAPVQSFNINSTTASTVTGAKGTVFSFPANIFVNAQNQPVTGTVNITLREIYSNADMILSNKATVANNGTVPLISGGEFYISAAQNGSPLHLAP